jgi:polysaccharide export outer membrane protein
LAAGLVGCLLASGCHTVTVAPPPPDGTVPRELVKVNLPPYVIEAPDVLLIQAFQAGEKAGDSPRPLVPQPIDGQHLVRMDGAVSLGVYGALQLSGLTIEQARDAVAAFLRDRTGLGEKQLYVAVDVIAYNSKAYYIITDGAGYGEAAYRFPLTGSETVLDALSQINGLPAVASKKHIWVARRNPGTGEQCLPVHWEEMTQQGVTTTNYQIMPGDRIYVKAEKIFSVDAAIAKALSPIERIFGVTLLGAETYNSITNRNNNNNNR